MPLTLAWRAELMPSMFERSIALAVESLDDSWQVALLAVADVDQVPQTRLANAKSVSLSNRCLNIGQGNGRR